MLGASGRYRVPESFRSQKEDLKTRLEIRHPPKPRIIAVTSRKRLMGKWLSKGLDGSEGERCKD